MTYKTLLTTSGNKHTSYKQQTGEAAGGRIYNQRGYKHKVLPMFTKWEYEQQRSAVVCTSHQYTKVKVYIKYAVLSLAVT